MTGPDRMREKLRALGRSADSEFAPDLDARIVEHVKLHGPGAVRRGRQRRAVLRAGALVLPVALAVVGWRALSGVGLGSGEVVARGKAPSTAKPVAINDHVQVDDQVDEARAGRAACRRHDLGNVSFAATADGRRVLELAERGRAVFSPGAEAALDSRDPCRLALRLVRGRVTVHAKDLMGGELRVQAGETDVVVHGTTFAVERVADGVSVDVAEGAVAVERGGRAVAPLVRTGQRLQLALEQAPVLLALSEAELAQLTAAVSEPAVSANSGAASEEAGENAVAAEEPAAVRPRRAPARSRTSASGSVHSAARFGASNRGSMRLGEGGHADLEFAVGAAETPEPSGAAHAIGSAAWERALADSSSATRAASPPSAAAGREPSRPSNASVSPEREHSAPAAPDSKPVNRTEPSPPVERAGSGETAAPAETGSGAEPPARAETPAQLVARADALWRRGSRDDARTLYRRAGAASGATAQAAWLALARREFAAGHASAARSALDGYTARFPSGALSEEAAGIEFRIALLEDDDVLAERHAKRLCERYPDSPAAQAAARWLRARGGAP